MQKGGISNDKRCVADPNSNVMNEKLIVSGKYELFRILGKGTTSTVYLARHIPLQRECAIKFYPKNQDTSLRILSEAQLLRSLHHPGIPEIYDIEEDDRNYYLIEEYVRGESLADYLSHQQSVSQNIFFTICGQICDIFEYLHEQAQGPILYQDLKPEHLILCDGQWKLIDFGCSQIEDHSGNSFRQCVNLDFSAPESFSPDSSISVTADIYSIGKLMEYLAARTEPRLQPHLRLIIQKCLQPDPNLRYQSVRALSLAIEDLKKENGQSTHLLTKIAVLGTVRGCGATHLGIALTSAVNALGIPCFYEERNNSGCLQKLADQHPGMTENGNGYYSCMYFQGFPKYGPGIRFSRPQGLILADYGTDTDALLAESADLILLICPDALWFRDDVLAKTKLLQPYGDLLRFICNPGSSSASGYYARALSAPVFRFFYDEDPFRVNTAKKRLAARLLQLSEKERHHLPWIFSKAKKSGGNRAPSSASEFAPLPADPEPRHSRLH